MAKSKKKVEIKTIKVDFIPLKTVVLNSVRYIHQKDDEYLNTKNKKIVKIISD